MGSLMNHFSKNVFHHEMHFTLTLGSVLSPIFLNPVKVLDPSFSCYVARNCLKFFLEEDDCAVLSRSVASDFLRPHGLSPARLLCPWGLFRQEY